MAHPSADELLAAYSPEELTKILSEELDAVGIPYTRNASDAFVFCPISTSAFDTYTPPVASGNVLREYKAVYREPVIEKTGYIPYKRSSIMAYTGAIHKAENFTNSNTAYDNGNYPAA